MNAMNHETAAPLKVLIVEDSHDDAILMGACLGRAGYAVDWKRVDVPEDLTSALGGQQWDVILCDYSMPRFTAEDALHIVRAERIDVPFIVVSGTMDEESAVRSMKAGANDYVMKDNIARLAPAVEREIRSCEARKEQLRARLLDEEISASQKRIVQLEKELSAVGGVMGTTATTVTGRMFGRAAIQSGYPELFASLMERYTRALELVLEDRVYDQGRASTEAVRDIAGQLGSLCAGPSDVADLHVAAIRAIRDRGLDGKALASIEEGRYLVLKVMGQLVSHYRNLCLGHGAGQRESFRGEEQDGKI